MIRKYLNPTRIVAALLVVLSVPLLYLISRYSYNLFHSLADGLTIVIAACAFVIVWHSRRNVDNNYFTYVGISLLFFAFLDLLHMLGNKNMGVFPGYGNLGPTFYIASRYLLSISFVIAPLFINRKLNTRLMFALYSLATSLILLSVFYWKIFPVCIIEGVGLTPFKVISDYIICLILMGGIGLLLINRRSFDSRVLTILVFSIVLSIATGLAFTLYTDPFGVTNTVGHLFQIASFYLVYVAVIETSLTKPQDILFRKLKQHEEKLTENVRQLDNTNVELQQEIAERKQIEEELHQSRDELELRVQERTESLRRQAEALSTSEKEFRMLTEAMPQIVWITDADGRNIYFNQQWVEYTGLTLEESYGHGWNKPFHPDDRQRAWDAWQNAVTNNGTYSLECRLRKADGTYRWWLVRGVPFVNEKGETTKWFGTCTDIEEFKRVEAQLRQAQKLEALGTLSGGIAHDFNNILAAIIGFGELLEYNVTKGSRGEHHLKRVLEASLRGRDLVRQLLTFSRKAEQEKKPVLLSSIVKETVKLVRATTPATIDIRLGSVRESGFVLGDSTQIQQVLMNLCTNAAHAMMEKGGTLNIELSDFSASPSNGNPLNIEPGLYMKLIVSDTGIGMPPDVMDRIFDPFFTTKGLGVGTGLGLSVVLGIVKQSNGYITAESEPGRGSTFTVYFPKITEEVDIAESGDESIPTGDERILFVDDEEALVEMGEDVLAEIGYDVTSRTSSKEALSLVKEDLNRFDLLITDQTMPGMTGVELAKEIFAIRPDMPIIMCTGFSHLVDADKAKAAGIRAFAMKPLTKREIARTIRQALDE